MVCIEYAGEYHAISLINHFVDGRTIDEPIKTNTVDTGTITLEDLDGDGFYSDEDCDDNDAQINPSVDELCDGFDNTVTVKLMRGSNKPITSMAMGWLW